MDNELITIVPESRRPYIWARNEMRMYFPKPDRFHITKLEEYRNRTNTHMSFFVGEPDEDVIMRVYWSDTNSVKYSIVTNYNELKAEHPEIVGLFVRNGVQAYEEFLAREQADRDRGYAVNLTR
ncbi:MAG: hypothetical protein IJH87_04840, partial [Atopobiaceae bacterium]|nr:hypothetical protein [Atopobiaceae bacterium]